MILLGAALTGALTAPAALAQASPAASGGQAGAAGQANDPMRLVLSAPIATWDEAVPLGNGLAGGLLWGEGRTLKLSLDRGDLWDLRTPEIYKAPDWTYATIQRLVREKNQAELVRRFDDPFEQIPYPTKLPGARLEIELEDGQVLREFSLDLRRAIGRAEFSGGEASMLFSAREPVAIARIRGSHPAFRLVAPASLAALGYSPARTGHDATSAWLVQDAALGLRYAVHVAARRAGPDTELAIAITSSREHADPLALARTRTRQALSRGFLPVSRPHEAWWRSFWSRSRVQVPDAAAQRHYDLVQYFYGAASRKGAPPMPLQGVWTADAGTLPPWKGDFHLDLNVQLTYWAYLQAGRFEEGEPYLDLMWRLVPAHRAFARRFFDTQGIVVPGVMALDGQPLAGWGQYSLSPVQGAWVAHAFYLHWRYTADGHFLATRAYPYCALVAEGLRPLLERGAVDGKLRLPLSTSPEIHDNSLRAWMTPMTNYDLALVRWLFGALSEMAGPAGHPGEAGTWKGVLARLDDLSKDDESGAFKVSPSELLTESHRHLSHLMAIHPLGIVTVEGSPRDRETIAASLDQLRALGTRYWCGYSFAWAAAMEARAGRAEEAQHYLRVYLDAFLLRNGFHANGDQTKSGYSELTYRPFTLEGNFAAAQAVHEMLLQSWGGIVRVFPATPAAWLDASFDDLRAEGGVAVSAVRRGGRTVEVRVRASHAGVVRLRDPFAGRKARWTRASRQDGRRVQAVAEPRRQGDLFIVNLRAGDVVTGVAKER
jgi:alpha-L-fucosidase 2